MLSPLPSHDSYAPPGLFLPTLTNPTAGAVGYGLSPLRGWGPQVGSASADRLFVRVYHGRVELVVDFTGPWGRAEGFRFMPCRVLSLSESPDVFVI